MFENKIEFYIDGMSCASCASNIEQKLNKEKGISKAIVNFATSSASIIYRSKEVNTLNIINYVKAYGYKPVSSTVELLLPDIHCASCISKIEEKLYSLSGIVYVSVNLANKITTISYLSEVLSLQEIESQLEKIGFKAKQISKEPLAEEIDIYKKEYTSTRKSFFISLVLTIPVFIIGMFKINFPFDHWVMLILTSIILFGPGLRFFRAAISGLVHNSADMNTLISVGTGSAYIYSFIITINPNLLAFIGNQPAVYFDTAAIIITLILLGRTFESKAKSKTTDAIKKLIELQPKTATIIVDGEEKKIDINNLKAGDFVIIHPGERIPVDGNLIEGFSSIDESMITGEFLPVMKNIGDKLISGTVNMFGSFTFEATKVGNETTLQQIIKMVKNAQSSKAPIQRLADLVSGYFVSVVILIAISTFITWYLIGPEGTKLSFALMSFVSVLIIACPCALGLATPTAIMVGTGLGAEKGILIKNAESLEKTYSIDTLAMDKTGTITKGQPQITDIFSELDQLEFIRLIASAEMPSEHPVGKAIVEMASSMFLDIQRPEKFNIKPGGGVSANLVTGENVLIGNEDFIKEEKIEINIFVDEIQKLQQDSKTIAYVAINNKLSGIIAVSDTIKAEAFAAIDKIKSMNIEPIMITGDNEQVAKSVAAKVGIEKVIANVMPEDKANIIADLQSKGKKVAMVGDGINDAPALVQADLGIAIGTGTDIAIDSSDVTIINGDLSSIVDSLIISKNTYKTIKQNLFFAFIYNIIAIPLAAGLLYPAFGILLNPGIAALAMALSSVSVVSNSLRLKKLKLSGLIT